MIIPCSAFIGSQATTSCVPSPHAQVCDQLLFRVGPDAIFLFATAFCFMMDARLKCKACKKPGQCPDIKLM
jgi:hypothetical protein